MQYAIDVGAFSSLFSGAQAAVGPSLQAVSAAAPSAINLYSNYLLNSSLPSTNIQLALNDPGGGGVYQTYNQWQLDQQISQMEAEYLEQIRNMSAADLPLGAGIKIVKGGMKLAKGTVNPKIYTQLEKQFAQHGPESIKKALTSAEKTLKAHVDKLPNLKYKSAVEKTITNVRNQIETIKKFMIDKGIK